MRSLNLSSLKASEVILFIAVLTMIFFKYSDNTKLTRVPSSLLTPAPLGDFGPSPYENFIYSQE